MGILGAADAGAAAVGVTGEEGMGWLTSRMYRVARAAAEMARAIDAAASSVGPIGF